MALQCLYAVRLGGCSPEEALEFVSVESDTPPLSGAREYCHRLLLTTIEKQDWADEAISRKLENWELGRVTFIDRLILELALVEMVNFEDVPSKVSISEAIEIAKIFSTEESPGFINGVLDAVYHELLDEKIIKE